MRWLSEIQADVRAKARWLYSDETQGSVRKAWCTDGTTAMLLYRLMQAAQREGLTPLAMLCNKLNSICCRCIIGRGATFGPRFVLIHSDGVVINSDVVGGSDIKLEHQVTIGAEKGQTPRLGNGVFVGAGAKIIGAVTIGAAAKIGANAVVTKDVPPGATAVGIPARII